MKRSPYFAPLLIILVLLVIALVVIRTDGADTEDESIPHRLAQGAIYAVLPVGTAFIAEFLLRKFNPASRAAREHKRSKKALDGVTSKKRKAEKRIKEIHDDYELYLYWVARIRGRFYRFFEPARARAGHTGPAIPSVNPNP